MKVKNIFEKVTNVIMNILIFIFGIILLISIYNNIQVKILGNDYASFFGYSLFEVQTGSMSGTIEAGDWIVVKYDRNIEVDDIITFKQNVEFITHRVIESYNGTYITKGDVNNTEDEPISKEQIVGEVVKILPGFGIISNTLCNPVVLSALSITLYLFGLAFKKNKTDDKVRKIDVFMGKIVELIKNIFKNITKKSNDKKTKKVIVETKSNSVEPELKSVSVETHEQIISKNEIEELENTEIPLEDMDKTIYFRKIAVDKDEIESAYNKIEIEEPEVEIEESTKEETVDEVKSNLEMLQKKKKFKNIIEKIMYIKNEEIKEMLDILTMHEKL